MPPAGADNRAMKPGAFVQPVRRTGRCGRKPREHHTVVAEQAELQPLRIGHGREEPEKIARKNRDLNHAGKFALTYHPAAYGKERLRVESRLVDPTVIDAAVAVDVSLKIIPIGEILRRRRKNPGGSQHRAVAVENPDRLHGGNCGCNLPHPRMQSGLVFGNVGVRHSRNQLERRIQRDVDQFERLERLFLLYVERAHEPLVGERLEAAIAVPAGEREQQAGEERDAAIASRTSRIVSARACMSVKIPW